MRIFKFSFTLAVLSSITITSTLATITKLKDIDSDSTSSLSAYNFKETIKEGLWFILFESPYCGHCRAFDPIWRKLIETSEKEVKDVKLREVNCVLNGDLCNANGVPGYPSMFMYENGKKVGEFRGKRRLDLLIQFLESHSQRYQETLKELGDDEGGKEVEEEVVVVNDVPFEKNNVNGFGLNVQARVLGRLVKVLKGGREEGNERGRGIGVGE